uniref:Putative secreted protein n=1 Tax=Ixodes ricinus TaxID=34613 RepID=A0A090X9H4_IXORI
MLLLEAMLVVLIVTIGHRHCSSIPPAVTSNIESGVFSILPDSSVLSSVDSEGCTKNVFPKEDLSGFLSLLCTKDCKDGKKRPETDGEDCIVTATQSTNPNEALITVGTCNKGTCAAKNPAECVTTTLESSEEEEEQKAEEEDEGEEDEDDEGDKR